VGARRPLIAWNLNLASDDLELARRIARAIRASSGGLPHVKAKGVRLAHRGLAQVSMNLTDYHATPMSRVFAEVERLATGDGVSIEGSEIIGLLPREALDEVSARVPWLAASHGHQVLEDRLALMRVF
jgi:glutamate formiminotransferase/glutamate formiminotransferase/formiminotetrahydrofolate cyclodeaminase